MLSLEEICERIRPADAEIMHQVWRIWDNKCIPLRSLDWLQETFVRIAGVSGRRLRVLTGNSPLSWRRIMESLPRGSVSRTIM